jgi:hypothetical protein
LNVFGVGQAVLSSKDARDHNRFPALRNRDIMIGIAAPDRDEATDEERERQFFRCESHQNPPDGINTRMMTALNEFECRMSAKRVAWILVC